MSTPVNQIEMEIDGSFTLDQISDGLIEAEEMKNRNLTALSMLPDGPNGEHTNLAVLVKQPIGVPFPPLVLVKASDEPPAGSNLLFKATIWVENEQTDVAAYR